MTTTPTPAALVSSTISDAATTARDVFSDQCSASKAAIDYMEQLLLTRLTEIQHDPEPQPVSQAALQPNQNISPICQPEPQPVAKVDELATIIRMLARHVPDDKQIKGNALDYLRRHGLQGSPLRDDATPSSAGTVSVEAAAKVIVDAWDADTLPVNDPAPMLPAFITALRALAGEE